MKYCEGKTMCFRKPSVIAYAAVVGKAENEGPYGGEFDEVVEDNRAGSDTWEQAESLFQQRAVGHVLRKSGLEPDRIDLMIAGDLLYDLFQRDGVSLKEHHKDCGLMIYDRAAQDVHAGGSGCGCSASMMCGHFFKRIQSGELKRVLYCATGALMSPTVVQQGGSIPGIAHCVEISSEAGG